METTAVVTEYRLNTISSGGPSVCAVCHRLIRHSVYEVVNKEHGGVGGGPLVCADWIAKLVAKNPPVTNIGNWYTEETSGGVAHV